MEKLDLESDNLQSIHDISLSIQIAAAGIATSFVLILIPNFETISLTAFLLGYIFRKRFAVITSIVMIISWEILATLVFSTSGIIFFFKLSAWMIIMFLGILARKISVDTTEGFATIGLISALIFDILVTIPYALLNSTGNTDFMTLLLSSLFVGLYFSIFHIIGNTFLFSLIPSIYGNITSILEIKYPSVIVKKISMRKLHKKRISAIVLALVIVLIIVLSSVNTPPPSDEVKLITITENISYNGIIANFSIQLTVYSNQSVFSILNDTTDIQYKKYANAFFVEGINNVIQNVNITGYYWIYYINGIRSNYASDNYYPANSDVILWNYESG